MKNQTTRFALLAGLLEKASFKNEVEYENDGEKKEECQSIGLTMYKIASSRFFFAVGTCIDIGYIVV